jgi:hypothetical protein
MLSSASSPSRSIARSIARSCTLCIHVMQPNRVHACPGAAWNVAGAAWPPP